MIRTIYGDKVEIIGRGNDRTDLRILVTYIDGRKIERTATRLSLKSDKPDEIENAISKLHNEV